MKDSIKIWKVNRPAISSTVKKYDHSVKQADRVIPAPRMFKRIANAGLLADLLPIIPPGADLSPASNLKADQVGKIPGAMHEDGGWIGFRGWPTHGTTEADLALWSRWPSVAVGLSCRTVRGLDVDVTDAALSEWIEGKALDLLGAAPARIGRWPKVLLPYLGGPDRKMRVAFTKGEPGKPGHEAHGVEWLANGQFFVVAGKHPKEGVGPYEWRGGALAVNHSDFPTGDHGIEQVGDILARVTVEQVTALFDAIAAHVVGLGFTVHNKRVGAGCIYSVRTASADFIADLPLHIARAADYLKRAEPAIEDAGGEPDTFVIAQKCMDLGCTPAMACGLMLEHWAGRCTPPWQEAELRVKVESAHHSRQNEVGCDALADPAEVFAPYLKQEQSQQGNTGDETPGTNKPDHKDKPSRFRAKKRGEYRYRPPMQNLIDAIHLPEEGVAMLGGDMGSLKSFLALGIAEAVATGLPAFGNMKVNRQGVAIYSAGEGARNIEDRRVPAYEQVAKLDLNDFPFYTISALPSAARQQECEEFLNEVDAVVSKEHGIKHHVTVVDTLARLMAGMNENQVGDTSAALTVAGNIVERHGGLAIVIHHFNRSGTLRGSSGIPAFIDWYGEVETFKDVQKEVWLVKLHITKDKDGSGEGKDFYFRGRKIVLGPGVDNSSLVLDQTSEADYKAGLPKSVEPLAGPLVGRAQREMGAVGEDKGVKTGALAKQMVRDPNDETAARNYTNQLNKRSHLPASDPKTLRGYAYPQGKRQPTLWWVLPSEETE